MSVSNRDFAPKATGAAASESHMLSHAQQEQQQDQQPQPQRDPQERLEPRQEMQPALSTRTPLSVLGPAQGDAFSNIDVALSWHNIFFQVGDRAILKNLTGTALACRLLVIMGKSGAGKTTLLKLLADRMATGSDRKLTGDVCVNNVPLQYQHRRLLAFVPQDDILDGHGTPEEVLSFSLRVRRGTSVERTKRHVDRTLQELGLTHVKETVIGVPGLTTGLSGGERKRANIGVELITQPKIMLLDEPTTGLDSVTAARVAHLLQSMARNGRTILCTLHQPTAEMLQYFDDLLLLSEGRVVYHGPMCDAVPYFTSVGYECPEDYTPTDYFMGLIQDKVVCPILMDAWDNHVKSWTAAGTAHGSITFPAKVSVTTDETKKYLDATAASLQSPWTIQAWELLKRSALSNLRDKENLMAQAVQTLVFAAFTSLLFMNLTPDVVGMGDRVGVLFLVTTNMGFSVLAGMINSFPPIKAVYIRDQASGSYSPFWFFVAKSIADFPLQLVTAFLQCVIIYWSVDFVPKASLFFGYFGTLLFVQQVVVGLGWILSAASPNSMVSSALLPVIMTPMLLAGGLLASSDRLSPYWDWLQRISFLRQGFVVLAHQEFGNMGDISCDPGKYNCADQPKNGYEAMQAYGLLNKQDQDYIAFLCLLAEWVVFRIFALLALWRAGRAKE